MKKAIIILTLAVIATWLLLMPGLVGFYLGRWVPAWLEESGQAGMAEHRSGWFSSDLRLDTPELRLTANMRHMPATRAAWLNLEGSAQPNWLDEPMQLEGQLGLLGNSRVTLSAQVLGTRTEPAMSSGPAELSLSQPSAGQLEAHLRLLDLNIRDQLGNHLDAGDTSLGTDWYRLDDEHAALSLRLSLDQIRAGLDLQISPIAIEPLGDLASGLEQLRLARPDTMDQQMAALTIAGAWQQLAEAGLQIDLRELRLDPDTAFQGQWETSTGLPQIEGEGRLETLLDWTATLIGLARELPPESAEREARAWLSTLVDHQWITPMDERFEFRFPPPEAEHLAPLGIEP